LERYRSNLLREPAGQPISIDEDHAVVYQTIGEVSTDVAMNENDHAGESATPPDSTPSTPMDEYVPVLASTCKDSPATPVDAALADCNDRFLPEEIQQENVPPAANLAFKEISPVDVYKSIAPAVSKIQPRAGHKRSNSALTESVTTSNLPMRKTRRPA